MKKFCASALLASLLLTSTAALAQWTTTIAQNTTVRDVAGVQEVSPLAVAGPNGGTYVSWFEQVTGTNYQMRLQLLDVNGQPQFGTAGLLISNQPQRTALFRYDLKSDEAGNALLAFQDVRNGGTATQCVIYKISPTGQQLWGANGIQLLDATTNSGLSPSIGFTGTGNVVVAWNGATTADATRRTGIIPMLKFTPGGTPLWTTPVRLQSPATNFSRPVLVTVPGVDEVVLSYVNEVPGSGLPVSTMYAQRYTSSGAAAWATPTQVSTKTITFTFFPAPVPDGNGGYYLQYTSGNPANAQLNDSYVQYVAADGTLPWNAIGTELLTGSTTQRFSVGLQYVAARNELWAVFNETNALQTQSGVTVQSLNATTGAARLGSSGQVVQAPSASAYSAAGLRNTGTGLLIVYKQSPTALNDVLWATKLNYQAQPAFTAPVQLSSATSNKFNFSLLPFANNQLVTVWQDSRQGYGIYAQTISDTGQPGTPLGTRPASAPQTLALSNNPGEVPVLHLTAARSQVATLLVYDMTGRLVWRDTAALTAGANEVRLAAPRLAAGTYLVQTSVDQASQGGRWVKP